MSSTRFDALRLSAHNYPFALPLMPRFADMDLLKHINNLALAEYHEEARVRFLAGIFGENFLFTKRDFRLLVARASYDYRKRPALPPVIPERARSSYASFSEASAWRSVLERTIGRTIFRPGSEAG
jgi:hypothetical protein